MKHFIAAICAIVFLAIASVIPASACGTGGSSTMYKHCDKSYRANWDRGMYGNGGAMDPRGWNGGRRTMPVRAAAGHYNGRVAMGVYGRTAVVRPAAPPPPPPSAQQIYSAVPHKTVSVCAPCDQTRGWNYIQDPETCQCDAVRWRPGPPPR